MEMTSYSEVRAHLKEYMDKACDNHEPIFVKRKDGKDVVILSKEDYENMDETAYLMRSPANAEMLRKSIAQAESGRGLVTFNSTEEMMKHFGLNPKELDDE